MAKQGEIDYLKKLGQDEKLHAQKKPFSDENCGLYLTDLGTVMSLLPKPPARILDLGVGTGWTSLFYAKRGYEVVGQDIAPDMIDLANKNKASEQVNNVEFIAGDYEELTFKETFDAAVFYDSLHHCIDEKKAMQSAYDALKPGGMLITVEPGEGHADSETSQAAKKRFGVTEKDMPPELIIAHGTDIGFKNWTLYQRNFSPVELMSSKTVNEDKQESLRDLLRILRVSIKNHFRKDQPDPPEVALLKFPHIVMLSK